MKLRLSVLCLLLAGALLLSPAAHAQGSRPPGRVVTEKEVLSLYFPELISEPRVNRLWFSPNEKYLLLERWKSQAPAGTIKDLSVLQTTPASETSLVLWDSRLRRSREVWSGPSDLAYIDKVDWLPTTEIALVRVKRFAPASTPASPDAPEAARTVESQLLLRITPEGDPIRIAEVDSGGYSDLEIGVSPILPLGVMAMDQEIPVDPASLPSPTAVDQTRSTVKIQKTFHLIDGKGQLSRGRALPENVTFDAFHWSPEGRPLVQGMEFSRDKEPVEAWFTFDSRTGDLHRLQEKPRQYQVIAPKAPQAPPALSPLRVRPSVLRAQEGDAVMELNALWLEHAGGGPGSKALICADCTEGRLLPGGHLIVYQSQESVWAVPLMRMSRDTAQEALRQVQKRVALQRAQMVGEELASYASDHQGELPPPDQILNVLNIPLGRDPSEWHKDLVYTFPGGKIPEGQKRETVEIGFYRSPVGRAVIFADGHVEWRDP